MSRAFRIVPIVEGQGEVAAVPVLLRRMVAAMDVDRHADVARPMRVSRDKVVHEGELERFVELAARDAGRGGCVLVLLDADDDCPAQLGPGLLTRARGVRDGLRVRVTLAMREFEAWYLAAAPSLSGQRGLPEDLRPPDAPESIRDAKGWLQDRRTDGFAYGPTTDQPALAAVMDLDQARRGSTSFAKLWRDVAGLLAET